MFTLFPLILLFCLIGAYSINNNAYEVFIMLVFGAVGYLMRKTGFQAAPFLFAMIIGPILETALRQSLLNSRGNFGIFFHRPISATLIGVSILLLLAPLIPKMRRERDTIVKKASDE